MDDALLVRCFKRFCDLKRDRESVLDRERPALQPLGQRLALDQLHDQKMPPGGLVRPIERGNVWVIQRGEHLRFALEPRRAVGVECPRLRQDFDRHLAPELRVPRAVHFAHAAGTERGLDLVRAEASAADKTHFFSPACQLRTTVIGAVVAPSPPAGTFTRKRSPSGEGA